LACDFRIAVEGAAFSLPEVGIGMVPGAGGTQRLPLLIGPTRAKEMILTGRRISADTALDTGLVSKVVPPDALMDEARTLAEEISANSPFALAHAKAAVDVALETTIEQGLRYETAAIRADPRVRGLWDRARRLRREAGTRVPAAGRPPCDLRACKEVEPLCKLSALQLLSFMFLLTC
jgi:enoyl-CoA hydratase/carnithine racemase